MYYNEKYDSMPLRGKATFYGWLRHHNRKGWLDESRKHGRKLHKHYDPYKDWWASSGFHDAWSWHGITPNKGHKRKIWKDYKYGRMYRRPL